MMSVTFFMLVCVSACVLLLVCVLVYVCLCVYVYVYMCVSAFMRFTWTNILVLWLDWGNGLAKGE